MSDALKIVKLRNTDFQLVRLLIRKFGMRVQATKISVLENFSSPQP